MWKGEGSKSEKVKQKREQDLQGRAQGAQAAALGSVALPLNPGIRW